MRKKISDSVFWKKEKTLTKKVFEDKTIISRDKLHNVVQCLLNVLMFCVGIQIHVLHETL